MLIHADSSDGEEKFIFSFLTVSVFFCIFIRKVLFLFPFLFEVIFLFALKFYIKKDFSVCVDLNFKPRNKENV